MAVLESEWYMVNIKKKHGFEAQNKLKFFIGEEYWAFTGD